LFLAAFACIDSVAARKLRAKWFFWDVQNERLKKHSAGAGKCGLKRVNELPD